MVMLEVITLLPKWFYARIQSTKVLGLVFGKVAETLEVDVSTVGVEIYEWILVTSVADSNAEYVKGWMQHDGLVHGKASNSNVLLALSFLYSYSKVVIVEVMSDEVIAQSRVKLMAFDSA